MKMVQGLVYLFIGYLVGSYFSPYIYLNLALTQWTNLTVYAWMLFWPFILLFKFLLIAIVIGIFVFILIFAWDWLKRNT